VGKAVKFGDNFRDSRQIAESPTRFPDDSLTKAKMPISQMVKKVLPLPIHSKKQQEKPCPHMGGLKQLNAC
jgi:hypothetical protein